MREGKIGREKARVICHSRCFHDGRWIRPEEVPEGEPKVHTQHNLDYWRADRVANALLTDRVDFVWVMLDTEFSWGKSTERLCYTKLT